MIGACALYPSAILGCGITAARRFRSQALLTGVVTVSILVACHFLIPIAGLRGAAVAVAAGCALKLLGQMVQVAFVVKDARP